MTEAAEIKDPAVAVHLARIEGKMGNVELAAAHTSQMLATLATDVRALGHLSAQSNSNDEAIKRLWQQIAERDEKWDRRLAGMDAAHVSTRDQVNRLQWMIAGAGLLGSVTVGLLTWIGNREITKIDDTANHAQELYLKGDERLDKIEIHLAGDRDRPYRR